MALSTLTSQEIDTVLEGMTLYAKGVRKARIRKEFTLELIKAADNIALSRMIIAVLEEYGCNKPGFAAQDLEMQSLFESYQKPGHAYFVIRKEGKICGGAGIAPLEGREEGFCELRKMYLSPEARGFGLGDLLIEICLAEAEHQGYKHCYLETSEQMIHAQNLYLKHGFKRVMERLGHTGHFGCYCFFG